MKKALLFLVSLFFFSAYAQNKKFIFKLGAEYGLPKKAEDLSFFGNETDGIVNFSLKKDELFITRFHAQTLALTYERQIDLGSIRNMNSEMIVSFDNRYYWLRSDWDKDREKEILYSNQVDVKTGKLDGTSKQLIETRKLAGDVAMTGWYRYKKVNKYQINYNADKTKLLVTYRVAPESRKDKNSYDIIGVYVFDNKMEKIWGKEFTMPYTEAVMDNEDFALDKYGNAYLLAKVYTSGSRKGVDKETGKPGYHLEVFKFTDTYERVYYYNDILATKIDAQGNFKWFCKIPKSQRGTNGRGTMSYKLISDSTGYYFLYLDNLKNLNLGEGETPKTHVDGLGGQVFVSKIDNAGKVKKEVVFNTRSEDVMIFPTEFTKINNNQFIGRARIKKTLFQPLLITVK